MVMGRYLKHKWNEVGVAAGNRWILLPAPLRDEVSNDDKA